MHFRYIIKDILGAMEASLFSSEVKTYVTWWNYLLRPIERIYCNVMVILFCVLETINFYEKNYLLDGNICFEQKNCVGHKFYLYEKKPSSKFIWWHKFTPLLAIQAKCHYRKYTNLWVVLYMLYCCLHSYMKRGRSEMLDYFMKCSINDSIGKKIQIYFVGSNPTKILWNYFYIKWALRRVL